jgi:pimeloyl-ACP methyl ester carboxylesterase
MAETAAPKRIGPGKVIGIILLAIVIAAAVFGVGTLLGNRMAADERQEALQPFYTPPDPMPTTAGVLLRREPLGIDVEGGTASRILYTSALADGTISVSGGLLFVPDSPAPAEGRPVIAWGHGTIGQGDSCAPSRSQDPLTDLEGWLTETLRLGWVVVATDYSGLGTPGPNFYLVGDQEARDLVDSVRAVQEQAQTGSRYAVYGHSQGGHAALWTGLLSEQIDPGLDLVAVAAAAPAAELELITGKQWNTAVGWVIGPEVAVSWPLVYPGLPVEPALSRAGWDNYQRLAAECIKPAALEGLVRAEFGQTFFANSPLDNPQWAKALRDQTPSPITDVPVLVAQGTADTVVLPWPNAVLEERWCAAGSNLTSVWLGKINHMSIANNVGPQVVSFFDQAFGSQEIRSTCGQPIPVKIPD